MAGLAMEGLDESSADPVLELEIASNRSDCLCHAGVAREAAAIYGLQLQLPDCGVPACARDGIPFSVKILNPRLCRRYCALLLSDVAVGPSPAWLQHRLQSVGQRPVNNIVDITNYVLLELGHPLHAFDLHRLAGGRIIVRTARNGEFLKTLDGFKRTLNNSVLVIADEDHPVAMAGIMGGEESEISTSTTKVLLESAHFDPISVRRTARSLGLSTEASYRFERGADVENAERAIGRCARLILEIAGGRVASSLIDVYPGRRPLHTIVFNPKQISRLTGASVDDDFAAGRLEALGFQVERRRKNSWKVIVPTFRGDVEMQADLVEEVARHYGYDRIPTTQSAWRGTASIPHWKRMESTAREALLACGFSEAVNTSFATQQELEQFPGYEGEPVELRNPISLEETRLRWNILPMLLRNCRHNFNHGVKNQRLFEMGKAYFRNSEGKVAEHRRLGFLLTGSATPASWDSKPREAVFFDLKGQVASLLESIRTPGVAFEQEQPPPFLNPRLYLSVYGHERLIGHLGRTSSSIEETYKFRQPVFVCDLDAELLFSSPAPDTRYRPLPKYPAVLRDISFVVDRRVQYNTIEALLLSSGIEALQGVELFDLYQFKGGDADRISLSIRLTYQSEERTLTVEEVSELDRRLISLLEERVGAALRC